MLDDVAKFFDIDAAPSWGNASSEHLAPLPAFQRFRVFLPGFLLPFCVLSVSS